LRSPVGGEPHCETPVYFKDVRRSASHLEEPQAYSRRPDRKRSPELPWTVKASLVLLLEPFFPRHMFRGPLLGLARSSNTPPSRPGYLTPLRYTRVLRAFFVDTRSRSVADGFVNPGGPPDVVGGPYSTPRKPRRRIRFKSLQCFSLCRFRIPRLPVSGSSEHNAFCPAAIDTYPLHQTSISLFLREAPNQTLYKMSPATTIAIGRCAFPFRYQDAPSVLAAFFPFLILSRLPYLIFPAALAHSPTFIPRSLLTFLVPGPGGYHLPPLCSYVLFATSLADPRRNRRMLLPPIHLPPRIRLRIKLSDHKSPPFS